MPEQRAATSEGAIGGGDGAGAFALEALQKIDAGPDEDAIFLTVKDMSHGIAGTAIASSIAGPLDAFGPASHR